MCVSEQDASINSRVFRHDRVVTLQTIAFGIPTKSAHLFGVSISNAEVADKEGWITTAASVLQTLGLAALLGPPFLAGRIKTTLGGYAIIVIALVPPGAWKSRSFKRDGEGASHPSGGLQWRSASEMSSSPIALVLSTTTLRIRYLAAPSPPLPLHFEVGRLALSKVAFERYDYKLKSPAMISFEYSFDDHAHIHSKRCQRGSPDPLWTSTITAA